MEEREKKIIESVKSTPLFCDYSRRGVCFYCPEVGHPINKKYGWTQVGIDVISKYIKGDITPDSVLDAYEHIAKLKQDRVAEFENACDYLYFGQWFNSFYSSCSDLSRDDALIIWRLAFDKMANF